MIRTIPLVLVAAIGAVPCFAQGITPDDENGRFSFSQTKDGLLRLDSRTGQVSLCGEREAGWACHVVPDERSALEAEIARLQKENGLLKRQIIANGNTLPGGVSTPDAQSEPKIELKLPSDAEVDRLMAFFERIWRRLVDMIQSTQRDNEKKG